MIYSNKFLTELSITQKGGKRVPQHVYCGQNLTALNYFKLCHADTMVKVNYPEKLITFNHHQINPESILHRHLKSHLITQEDGFRKLAANR